MDETIRMAIAKKRLIEFTLHGLHRVAEPHVYGLKGGVPQILVYQVRGQSKSGGLPGWRRVDLAETSSLRVLDETFPGRRPATTGEHSKWDQIFAVVS